MARGKRKRKYPTTPRNLHAVVAMQRKGGAHADKRRSKKAEQTREKREKDEESC